MLNTHPAGSEKDILKSLSEEDRVLIESLPLSEDEKKLVRVAFVARDRAYAPYSHYRVGSAILGEGGEIFAGCNVENISYGATICAERNAIASAVVQGVQSFGLAVIAAADDQPCPPCGMCRQVLSEFDPMFPILLVSQTGSVLRLTLDKLLPMPFEALLKGPEIALRNKLKPKPKTA